jgi:hypothetical protein
MLPASCLDGLRLWEAQPIERFEKRTNSPIMASGNGQWLIWHIIYGNF